MGKVQKFDQNSNTPVIAGVEITTDGEGRINLNSLHKASGGAKKDGPSYWFALDSTRDLVREYDQQTTGISVVKKEGRYGGTFVAEELAISYAGWISPAFQLEVNRTFIAVRKGEVTNTAMTMTETKAREVRLQTKMFASLASDLGLTGNQAILSTCRGVERMTGVNPMELMGVKRIEAPENDDLLNPGELGKLIGLSSQEANKALTAHGLQTPYRDAKNKLRYDLTDAGEAAGGKWCDVQKAQGGRPVRQLMWPSSVAAIIRVGGAA